MLHGCTLFALIPKLRANFYMRFAMEEYNRETPLFDQRLTILLQSKEKEEKQLPITVRLLTGSRVSLIHLTISSTKAVP